MKLTALTEGLAKNLGRTEQIIHKYFEQSGNAHGVIYYEPKKGFLASIRDAYDENPSDELIQSIGYGPDAAIVHLEGGGLDAPLEEDTIIDIWKKIRNP